MPPPSIAAVLPLTTLFVSVSLPLLWMPPPRAPAPPVMVSLAIVTDAPAATDTAVAPPLIVVVLARAPTRLTFFLIVNPPL